MGRELNDEEGGGGTIAHRQPHQQTHIPGFRQAQQSNKKTKTGKEEKQKRVKQKHKPKNQTTVKQNKVKKSKANDGGVWRGGSNHSHPDSHTSRHTFQESGSHTQSQHKKKQKKTKEKKQKRVKQKHQNYLGRGWGMGDYARII